MMKWYAFILYTLTAGLARAYSNDTLNISACGSVLSNANYTSVGSLSPLGGQSAQSVSFYNISGFAARFILQPGTSFSGLPDELNPDNDLDGLQDSDEIMAGSSLYKSDTDEDGMNDAHELIAGTSPTDHSSVLSVSCAALHDGRMEISWFGVQGRTYLLQYTDSLSENRWISYVSGITGEGYMIILLDDEMHPNRFYRIKAARND